MGGAATVMRGRMLAGAALVPLGLLVAPPVASARPAPISVKKSVRVAASGVTSLTLTCPSGSTALSGAVVSTSAGVDSRDSVPQDAGRWTFRFTALAGASARRATAVLRCVRISRTSGVPSWRIMSFTGTREVRVPALGSRRVRVRCVSGYLATGYGIDRAAADPVGPLPSGEVLVTSAVPSRSSFLFRLENTGADPTRVSVRVRCLGRTATGRRGGRSIRQTFVIRRAGFADRVSSGGRRVLRHRCPPGHFSLANGLAMSVRDDIFLTGAHPEARRAGSWSFNHPAGASQRVRTYLACLDLGTSFR